MRVNRVNDKPHHLAYDETLSKRYQGADEKNQNRSSSVSDMQFGVTPISETIIQTDSMEPVSSNDQTHM